MTRREFAGLAAGAGLAAAQNPSQDTVTATASQDKTPRVGIVLSDFKGSQDHDGTPLAGLADPRPPQADLSAAQIDAMVRKAIELGNTRDGGLRKIVAADDWVVIKTDIASFPGPDNARRWVPGMAADPRIVRSLVGWLAENGCGGRFTIAEGSGEWQPASRTKAPTDGWNTDWRGAFGGLSYRSLVADLAKRYSKVRFEILDLNFADAIEAPVPGKACAGRNPDGMYTIGKLIQQCDRLISVAPLKTHPAAGVSLAMLNYLGIAPGSVYGFPKAGLLKLGTVDEVAVDLFSFHPADYALAGGCWGLEGDGVGVHHNLILAGANAVAVDAVGATVMGFAAADLSFLKLAWRKGLGIADVDSIWTRGNEIEQARRVFLRARPVVP